jgi:hypothetical protein
MKVAHYPFSVAIALNIRIKVCLTVATPFDKMDCNLKSWRSHFRHPAMFNEVSRTMLRSKREDRSLGSVMVTTSESV